ncbi:MAG: hypothetical protein M1834_009612 [Cirrosporium novae-zelandiae]|nr:MAG: hypothetical protein M1834_009612 [Cirrosporium novae-zelandiae]
MSSPKHGDTQSETDLQKDVYSADPRDLPSFTYYQYILARRIDGVKKARRQRWESKGYYPQHKKSLRKPMEMYDKEKYDHHKWLQKCWEEKKPAKWLRKYEGAEGSRGGMERGEKGAAIEPRDEEMEREMERETDRETDQTTDQTLTTQGPFRSTQDGGGEVNTKASPKALADILYDH